ncbi:hypothetical protein [Shewanella sp. UCD-KL12]|uniref:hypothetical protein n=1 Tax=Shewanella sp. UCD-KL12 TaxID=1917163 RepID=UPI000970671C|nr:hypothetical protein [Shewanella sp. UCD-KL12]
MSLNKYGLLEQKKYEDFKGGLLKRSVIPCEFEVGDFVTFTNEYGIFFRKPKQVIGFDDVCDSSDRFIYTESEAWWFPSSAAQLKLAERTSTGCLLVRELTPQSLYKFENELIEDDDNWQRIASESSLHAVWANDEILELVTYCEGDIIWATALSKESYDAEVVRNLKYFLENN